MFITQKVYNPEAKLKIMGIEAVKTSLYHVEIRCEKHLKLSWVVIKKK